MILFQGKQNGEFTVTEAVLARDGRLTVFEKTADCIEGNTMSEMFLNFNTTGTYRLAHLLGVTPEMLPAGIAGRFGGAFAAERFRRYCDLSDIRYQYGCL